MLLVLLALAAADGGIEDSAKEVSELLAGVRKEDADAEQDHAKELTRIQNEATDKAMDIFNNLKQMGQSTTRDMDKLAIDVSADSASAIQQSSNIVQDAQKSIVGMEDMTSEVVDLAQDTLGLFKDEGATVLGKIQDTSDEAVDSIIPQIEEQVEAVEESYDRKKDERDEQTEQLEESLGEVVEDVSATAQKDEATYEQIGQVDKELENAEKASTRARSAFASDSSRTVHRVIKSADKLPGTVKALEQRGKIASERAVDQTVKLLTKQVAGINKETDKERQGVVDMVDGTYNEVKDLFLQSMFDFRNQKSALKKETAMSNLELTKLLLEAETALASASAERETLQETAEDDKSEQLEELQEDRSLAREQGMQLAADIDASYEQTKEKFEVARENMVDVVGAHLAKTRADIEDSAHGAEQDFKKSLETSMSNMEKAVDASKLESTGLNNAMNMITTRLGTVKTGVAEQAERNAALEGNLRSTEDAAVHDVQESMSNIGGEADEKMQEVSERLLKQVKDVADNQDSLAAGALEGLDKKVTKLKESAEKQLERSGRTVHSAAGQAQDSMQSMKVLAQSIGQLSERLHEIYPENSERAGEALTLMEARMLAARNERLPSARDTAQAMVQTRENAFHEDAAHNLGDVRRDVTDVLATTGVGLQHLLAQSLLSTQDFKSLSAANFDEFYKYNFNSLSSASHLRAGFKAAQMVSGELEEATTARVQALRHLAEAGVKAQIRDSSVLQRSWILHFLKDRAAARELATQQLAHTVTGDDAALSAAEAEGARKMDAAEAGAVNQTGEAETETESMNARVDKQIAQFGDASAIVKGKQVDLARHLDHTTDLVNKMEINAQDRIAKMRDLLSAHKTGMEQEVQTTVDTMRKQEDDMMERALHASLLGVTDEGRKQAMANAQVAASFGALTGEIRARTQPVVDRADATTKAAHALTADEAASANDLVHAMIGLDAAEKLGADKIAGEARVAERDGLGTSQDDQHLLEGVVTSALGAAGSVGKEIAEGSAALMHGVDASQAMAEEAAQSLSERAGMMDANAPDFRGMFVNDTAESRDSIAASWESLDQATKWIDAAFLQYDAGLAEAQKERAKLASQYHHRISKSKAEMVNQTTRFVKGVEQAKEFVQKAKVTFENHEQEMQAKLNTLGKVSSSHDEDEVGTLDGTLSALRHVHNRLGATYGHFYHHGEAFRAEVDRQLGSLEGGMEEAEHSAAASRLAQQVHMNQALRATMLRVQKGSAAETSEEAHNLGALSTELGDGLHAMLDTQSAAQRQSDLAQGQAYAMIDERSEETKSAMAIAMENDAALRAAVEELRQEQQTASAQIKGALFLPQLTASPRNQALDSQIQGVKTRMDRAEIAAVSLLEERSRAETAAESQSRERARSRAEAAVAGANAELAAQNRRLSQQNRHLQVGIDRAWRQVAQEVGVA